MSKILNIGTIGHVDHGKTTLTVAITKVLSDEPEEIIFPIRNENILEDIKQGLGNDFKSGRELRRERRKKDRKNGK